MARPGCPRCGGAGVVEFTAVESRGGKPVRTIVYKAECPRCEAVERFLDGKPKHDPMRL